MAHTLFYKSNKDLPQSLPYIHPPPSSWTNSPSLQVPDVFLIAPEEENAPPWLLFDAAKDSKRDLSRTPDLDFLDVALDALHQVDRDSAQIVSRDSIDDAGERLVMSRRGFSRPGQRAVTDEEIPWPGIQGVESEGDSVVVEVVKVRKVDGLQEAGDCGRTMKRSRTFKAAAFKAFRSIKNVAKGTNRKPLAQDIWSPSGESSHVPRKSKDKEQPQAWPSYPRTSTPTISRRSSLTLTQLFHTPSKKSHSSSDTTEHHLSSSVFSPEPIFSNAPSCNPVPLVRQTEPAEIRDNDDRQLKTRPISPSLSTKSSFRRRFSMLELHRVFLSSKSSESLDTSPAPVLSCDGSTNSSAPSTSTEASFEMPGTPDEAYASTPFPILREEKSGRGQRSEADIAEPDCGGNVSLEMKLESLHFDDLSFDPDVF